MPDTVNKQQVSLKSTLAVLFVLALAMGTGPGLYLVNPDPSDGAAAPTVGGMPVLFVWAAAWLFVLIVIVLVAYFRLWNREEETV